MELDKTDRKILEILQVAAKSNVKEVAAQVGLTITPTYERIKKLEQAGIIKGYTIDIDHHKLGKSIEVFCQVSLSSHAKTIIEEFEREVARLDEVLDCYHLTGGSDYMLRVLMKDMEAYRQFLTDQLSVIDNVSNVQSMFVMKRVKDRAVMKVV